ncbi:CDT1 [Bugula neritina]|uniref:CDT1 n=1 Tax=Bugula neritina TaxID=10212 RepID=A0A7J7KQV5_BUGNE|nr:CDT1 [Bugula neritina]
MPRDPRTKNEIAMLERLPVVRYFITENKNALHEDKVIVTLCDSYKSSISQSSVEDHISYMLQIFPNWISPGCLYHQGNLLKQTNPRKYLS